MPPTARLVVLLAAVLAAAPAQAQYRGADDVRFEPREASRSLLTVGAFVVTNGFEYDGLARPGVPSESRRGVGVQLAGPTVRLTAGYVGAIEPGAGAERGPSTVVALEVGPAWRPVSTGDSLYLSALVPIRLGLGYESLEPPAGADAFHLGRVGLGAGLGVEAGALIESAAFAEIVGRVTLALQPGVLTDFSDTPFDVTFGQRTAIFDADVRVLRLGGTGLGLVVGYTRQNTRRSPTPLGGDEGVFGAVSASGYVDQSQFGIIRFGLAL